MSDLVGNPEDHFSRVTAHLEQQQKTGQKPQPNAAAKKTLKLGNNSK